MKQDNFLPEGTILRNGERQYVIKSVLGHGGFGITYLATGQVRQGNITGEMSFAIKEHFDSSMNVRKGKDVVISNPNNVQEIEESIKSFLSEAHRLNKLSLKYPGIVCVNESFEENGTAYYVMEYIRGESLRNYTKQSSKGYLPEQEAIRIIKAVSSSVLYLHEARILHLDIKPDNVIMRDDGNPVLIDFGLAKRYDKKGNPTRTNKATGCSDGYAPLEQYAGIKVFTPEADIYALAATLVFMLTGRDPKNSADITPSIIQASLEGKCNSKVMSAVLHAMEKLKENRTHSVRLFQSELENGAYTPNMRDNGAEIATKKLPPDPKPFPWKRTGLVAGVGVGILLCVLLLPPLVQNTSEQENGAVIGSSVDTAFINVLSVNHNHRENEDVDPSKTPMEREMKTDVLSDEEKYEDAIRNKDYAALIQLAKSGFSKAYYPVAEYYYSRKDYRNAKLYAQKAVTEKVDVKKSHSMLNNIERLNSNSSNVASTVTQTEPKKSDDEIYAQAKAAGDWATIERLGNKGYAKAYYSLALHYYNKGEAVDCKKWSQKAINAGVQTEAAKKLLNEVQ